MYGYVDGFLGRKVLEEKYYFYKDKYSLVYASSMGQDIALIDIINQYIEKDKPFILAEIGVLAARTAVVLLDEFQDRINYIGVDPLIKYSAGTEVRMKEARETAIFRLKDRKNAVLLLEQSLKIVKQIEDESIDIVFVDAQHDYKPTKLDILHWWPKAKKLLAVHDYMTYKSVGDAVDEFAKYLDLEVKTTFGDVAYIIKQ